MIPVRTLLHYQQMMRARHYDRAKLEAIQGRKLRRLVLHAYRTVPYYRRRFDEAGLDVATIRSIGDLAAIPITTKSHLQQEAADQTVSTRFAGRRLHKKKTSGSSGRPLDIYYDSGWIPRRKALFARALSAAGYRLGARMLAISTAAQDSRSRWFGTRRVPFDTPAPRLWEILQQRPPDLLYGWVTPLRQLVAYAASRSLQGPKLKAIVTTAEPLDGATRALLRETFACDVFEIYGLTEIGSVAWECTAHAGYHVAEDCVLAEYVPTSSGGTRLVLTCLDQLGMPFIRYDCGDLAVAGETDACSCGCKFVRIGKLEGRMVDCVMLRDGREISPYEITTAMEAIEDFRRYQVVQNDYDQFTIRFEAGAPVAVDGAVAGRATEALREIVGPQATVALEQRENLDPPAPQKFRVVECRLPARTSAAAADAGVEN